MAEWLNAADCKSVLVRVRWFESISAHQELSSILKRILLFLFLIKKWIRKGGLEKRPVDGFPDAARRIPIVSPANSKLGCYCLII